MWCVCGLQAITLARFSFLGIKSSKATLQFPHINILALFCIVALMIFSLRYHTNSRSHPHAQTCMLTTQKCINPLQLFETSLSGQRPPAPASHSVAQPGRGDSSSLINPCSAAAKATKVLLRTKIAEAVEETKAAMPIIKSRIKCLKLE